MPISLLPPTVQKRVITGDCLKTTMRLELHLTLLEKEKKPQQSAPYKTILDDDRKRYCDCQIRCATLLSPKESSFVTLFESGDD
jgi:hypothetical protein